MPKLADIIEATKSVMEKEITEQKQQIESCNKCNGTGIVLYYQDIEGISYQYGARCTCKNAMQWSKKIPSIQQLGLIQ